MHKLAANPEQIKRTLHQAIELQQRGKLKAAERKYRSILKVTPRHTDALQFLAVVLQQNGNPKAALHFMQKALKVAPDNPRLLSNQAEIYRMQDNYDLAEKYARQALEINPELVDPMVIIASALQAKNDFEDSAEYYNRALALTPNAIDVRNELGNVLSSLQRYAEAAIHYRRAIEQNPEFDDCRLNLADTLVALDEPEDAITEYRHLLRHQPDNLTLLLKLVQVLINHNQPEDAKPLLTDACKLDDNNPLVHYWLGIYSQTMGDFDLAGAQFEQAIRLGPDYVDPWYRLSLNRGFKPTTEQLSALESRFQKLEADNLEDPELVPLGFALARFYEQKNNFEQSFRHYQRSNRIKSRLEPFDGVRHDEQIENIIDIFDADFYAQRNGWGNSSKKPVFIVGMPRSGTTLTEQIISTHAKAHGGGELPMMLKLVDNLKQKKPSPATGHARLVAELGKNEVQSLAEQYLSELSKLNKSASIIIDKLPGNYFRLGVILLLFPNARIIHCRRHPVATCWSCYQQNFERGLRFTNDLDHLILAYKGYERLMQHWHSVKPGSIFDLKYEALLEDPQQQCQELLKFCGLDWDSAVLDFHHQQRPVSTASVWQVRQPLDPAAPSRWKTFEPYLQDLKSGLGIND